MLIEIHMIQNHSPGNLNRDDLGAPKSCIFGGTTRARISSQCLKRSVRRSPEFAAALENDCGVRTRRLIEEIAKAAADEGQEPSKKHLDAIRKVFADGGVPVKKDENTFDILFFLPQSAIEKMGAVVRDENSNLGKAFADILGEFVKTPDIALCGRMTEFDAKGAFKDLKGKFTVEAALSAAHAISTHAVVNEVDYFTAADDVPGPDAGAAHVNEAIFNSACFYKHFVIDFEQLKKNLSNDEILARKTVKCFLEAVVKANPSGKQHAYAAFNPSDGILVEVKTECNTPISYANAFADSVPEKSERGLIGESIARLDQYVCDITEAYGVVAERLWFSPNLRYQLTAVNNSSEKIKRDKSASNFAEFGNFNKFIEEAMKKIETPAQHAEATA